MRLGDIVNARAKWAKAHGKMPKRMLMPQNLYEGLEGLCAELMRDGGKFTAGQVTTLMGMKVQLTPIKNGELDFA